MSHMILDEFDNELDGNDLMWRVVFNHSQMLMVRPKVRTAVSAFI